MHCVELSNFELDEYVTAIAWMPDGSGFVAATARGEIVCLNKNLDSPKSPLIRGTKSLREADGFSIDALKWSADGVFLAAAGQRGALYVWDGRELVTTLIYSGWIDQLAWHPGRSLLAFGVGKIINIWNAETQTIESSLELLESSVLGLTWNAQGDRLMASGNRVVKCWDVENWNTTPQVWPQVWELSAACGSIDWAPGDLFFAAGCFDRTVIVASEFGSDNPWRMSGFPEKVSLVAWSSVMNPATECPLLATVSRDGIVIWNWTGESWDGTIISSGGGRINSIAWQPGSLVFAIAVEERVELRMLQISSNIDL